MKPTAACRFSTHEGVMGVQRNDSFQDIVVVAETAGMGWWVQPVIATPLI
jgi:Na+-transporting NADH:ubiquinone oxidoreductase subunit NqrE